MPDASSPLSNAAIIARELGPLLEERGHEYAFGGAIAMAFWSEPRATIDVDLTLFLAPDATEACLALLQDLGCQLDVARTRETLAEHGFCRVRYRNTQLDVFLPTLPFYELAKQRRVRVELGSTSVLVWSAEVLAVFKMMFFRLKDLGDVEQMLRIQGAALDRDWVRERLLEIYGPRDPRVSRWDDLCREEGLQP
ncbi:MAG TPA: nucleotidyl transferase AbiEii/AbiGii toxin family protein [Planctomycetaceae bacterium]|nr:nucleotidyl transferase AbiEii/AbiGii toxin family protein [Planctomycetaceae bacterium]